MADMEPVMGIDLGTTFSAVAVWDWDLSRAEIVANENQNRTTPSVVCYYRNEILIGDTAKSKMSVAPAATIYNAKRVIGRQFEQLPKADLGLWPFKIVANADGKPRYEIQFQGEAVLVAPEEVAAYILMSLKEAADRRCGREVTKCVITVPAYFTEPQKRATRDAGEIAGLEVLSLLTEPTAAALAYGLDQKTLDEPRFQQKAAVDGWNVLVFDLGGGTLDVCVLSLNGRGSFLTKSITGDFHLGGEDLDSRIVEHVVDRFAADHPGLELNQRARQRLRGECERVKRLLSTADDIPLDVSAQGVDAQYVISRRTFEALAGDLFDRALHQAEEAVHRARLAPRDIDDVVLIGGSTRIPKLRERLQNMFPGRELWCSINPDEAVALGAAIQAAALYSTTHFSDVPDANQHESISVVAAARPSPPNAQAVPPASAGAEDWQDVPEPSEFMSVAQSVVPPSRAPTYEHPGGPPPGQQGGKVVVMPPGAKKMPMHHAKGMPPPPHAKGVPIVVPPPHGKGAPPPPAAGKAMASPPPADRSVVPAPASAAGGGHTVLPQNIVLGGVAPFTLGIALADGTMDPVIPRGTPLPARHTDRYTTNVTNQPRVNIKIVEGEKKLSRDNHELGKFSLKVPPAPAGAPQILVTFDVSAEGLLTVTGRDEATGHKHSLQVSSANLSGDERATMQQRTTTHKGRRAEL